MQPGATCWCRALLIEQEGVRALLQEHANLIVVEKSVKCVKPGDQIYLAEKGHHRMIRLVAISNFAGCVTLGPSNFQLYRTAGQTDGKESFFHCMTHEQYMLHTNMWQSDSMVGVKLANIKFIDGDQFAPCRFADNQWKRFKETEVVKVTASSNISRFLKPGQSRPSETEKPTTEKYGNESDHSRSRSPLRRGHAEAVEQEPSMAPPASSDPGVDVHDKYCAQEMAAEADIAEIAFTSDAADETVSCAGHTSSAKDAGVSTALASMANSATAHGDAQDAKVHVPALAATGAM